MSALIFLGTDGNRIQSGLCNFRFTWEGEDKSAAFAELTLDPDTPGMVFHQPLGDRQAQTRAFPHAFRGFANLAELIKNSSLFFGKDAQAGVGYRYPNEFSVGICIYTNSAAASREL